MPDWKRLLEKRTEVRSDPQFARSLQESGRIDHPSAHTPKIKAHHQKLLDAFKTHPEGFFQKLQHQPKIEVSGLRALGNQAEHLFVHTQTEERDPWVCLPIFDLRVMHAIETTRQIAQMYPEEPKRHPHLNAEFCPVVLHKPELRLQVAPVTWGDWSGDHFEVQYTDSSFQLLYGVCGFLADTLQLTEDPSGERPPLVNTHQRHHTLKALRKRHKPELDRFAATLGALVRPGQPATETESWVYLSAELRGLQDHLYRQTVDMLVLHELSHIHRQHVVTQLYDEPQADVGAMVMLLTWRMNDPQVLGVPVAYPLYLHLADHLGKIMNPTADGQAETHLPVKERLRLMLKAYKHLESREKIHPEDTRLFRSMQKHADEVARDLLLRIPELKRMDTSMKRQKRLKRLKEMQEQAKQGPAQS